MRYKARIEDELFLGKQGENGAVTIVFPINAFYKEFGTYGVFEMLHQRAEDDDPYPCTFTQTIEGLEWTISNADNAYDGLGWLEIRYIVKDIVIKSITWRTRTLPALDEPTDIPPAPYKSWVDEVTKAGAAAVSARDAIENMSVAAQQTDHVSVNKSIDAAGNVKLNFGIPRGTPGYTPIKGVDYFDGKDGHTPTADEIKQVLQPELDAIDSRLEELAENKGVVTQAEFINGKFSFMNSKGEEMYSATLPVYRGEAT